MSQTRFERKWEEQVRFVDASCRSYDAGTESEALRIAVSLRVLFHDTATSTSLVSHLGIKDHNLLSSKISMNPLGEYTSFVRIEMNFASPTPVRAVPVLGDSFDRVPLDTWWRTQPVYSFDQRQYYRRDLVLAAANQDGGAHVDAKLNAFYVDLASGVHSLGVDGKNLKYKGTAPFDQSKIQYPQNLHQAMIRQFGHEFLASVSASKRVGEITRS